MLMTRIRVGRSPLNAQQFAIGSTDSPQCDCLSVESSLHYYTQCLIYASQRLTLYGLFEHYIPHFNNLTNKQKHDIILYGYKMDHDEYLYTNTKLTLAVQKYIVNTKRFIL